MGIGNKQSGLSRRILECRETGKVPRAKINFGGFGVYQALALIVRYLSPYPGNLKGRAGVYT
jgi:hypothetical protein